MAMVAMETYRTRNQHQHNILKLKALVFITTICIVSEIEQYITLSLLWEILSFSACKNSCSLMLIFGPRKQLSGLCVRKGLAVVESKQECARNVFVERHDDEQVAKYLFLHSYHQDFIIK